MILHLGNDNQFMNYFVDLFEETNPGANLFLIGLTHPYQRFRHIKKHSSVEKCFFGGIGARRLKHIFEEVDLIVIHFLDPRWWEVLDKKPQHIKVVWIFWGGDAYNLPLLRKKIYQPLTARFVEESSTRSVFDKLYYKLNKLKDAVGAEEFFESNFLLGLVYEIKRMSGSGFIKLDELRIKCFAKVDYAGTFLKEDYNLLIDQYPFTMKWIDARFISIHNLLGHEEHVTKEVGSNILLGNSCTYENNHLDALERMSSLKLSADQKIICPLSYGKDASQTYISKLIKTGRALFDDRFIPLTDYLPLSEYNQILDSCGISIMNHNRQQAFNNILALLYKGSKVYLTRHNTILHFLRRLGCIVFEVDELSNPDALKALDFQFVQKNRDILSRQFNTNSILQSAKQIIDLRREGD